MKKIILFLLMMFAANAQAADQKKTYYSYPDAATMPDNGRIQMYDPALGSLNVTGLTLRTTPSDTPLTAQPISGVNPYKRTFESRDSNGNINYYTQANGNVVVVGVLTIGAAAPAPLTVSSIAPANGSTGFIGGPITLTFNKYPNSTSSAYMYVNGVTTTNIWPGGSAITSTAYLAPSTSYTYKVVKNTLATLQIDGETTASCGTAMTDVGGVCQSTFTTGLLNISSVYPAVGEIDVAGIDGSTFNTTPSLTYNLTTTLSAGQYTCSSSSWDGAAWVVDSAPGAFTNTSNIIYTLPSMIYHKSYDADHLTTYTCSLVKPAAGCLAGMTDTGTACTWTFTTAM